MTPRFRYFFTILFAAAGFSCSDTGVNDQNQFYTGPAADVTIRPVQYDEFQRIVPFRGPASLTLVTADNSYYGAISSGDSSLTFKSIPLQPFILRAEKEGYYPFEDVLLPVNFYPLPTLEQRIDSLQVGVENNTVSVRAVAHQQTPKNGRLSVIFFFGTDSTVSAKPESWFYTTWVISSGTNELSVYFSYHFPAGTKIFVTARLANGATISFYDNAAGKYSYLNIEENTTAVQSFTY